MIRKRVGIVSSVISQRPGLAEISVLVEGREELAINYEKITGMVEPGDRVLLNTTAVSLNLGTGGYHYVMAIMENKMSDPGPKGHIMKMRYTPFQLKVLSVEEQVPQAGKKMLLKDSIDGIPVVVGSLHSMLAPVAASIRHAAGPGVKLTYLMTDGGSLPIWFSRLVHNLKITGVINDTITCGHAFGGDYEAVNVYSALLWAKACGAEAVIVSMGPGIVGTATEFGHTAIEQGEIVNAINVLGGHAIAVPRISFADSRSRHYGISHHTLTALGKVALSRCTVVLPLLKGDKKSLIERQLWESGIYQKHAVVEMDVSCFADILDSQNLSAVTTMGRTKEEDPEFFQAACAAGIYTAGLLNMGDDKTPNRRVIC